LLTSVQSTLVKAQKDRNSAVAFIHSITPPAPPPGDGRVLHQRGGAVVGDWYTVMPQNILYLDDEIQQLTGTLSIERKSLQLKAKQMLRAAKRRDVKTEARVNQYWPPLPADG
jgi:hypothetical protein